jgi:hypothetical protein
VEEIREESEEGIDPKGVVTSREEQRGWGLLIPAVLCGGRLLLLRGLRLGIGLWFGLGIGLGLRAGLARPTTAGRSLLQSRGLGGLRGRIRGSSGRGLRSSSSWFKGCGFSGRTTSTGQVAVGN